MHSSIRISRPQGRVRSFASSLSASLHLARDLVVPRRARGRRVGTEDARARSIGGSTSIVIFAGKGMRVEQVEHAHAKRRRQRDGQHLDPGQEFSPNRSAGAPRRSRPRNSAVSCPPITTTGHDRDLPLEGRA